MKRVIRLFVILWHFAALPALCQYGVLEHLCPEDASATCSHEEGCSSDPCSYSNTSLSKETLRDGSEIDPTVALSASAMLAEVATEPPTRLSTFLRAHAMTRAPLRAFPLRN